MSNVFGNLEVDANMEDSKDILGGKREPLESDVYALKIKSAYITYSAKGAMAVNFDTITPEDRQFKFTEYVTSGKAKGCKNFYEDKDGNRRYLPGFNSVNAICLLTVGKELVKMPTEKKIIPIYDFDTQQEEPTEVDVLSTLAGKAFYAAIIRKIENKRKHNESTGDYEPTAETRTINEVDKIFKLKNKLTVLEIKAGKTEPVFMDQWLEKFKGVDKDVSKKIAGGGLNKAKLTGRKAPQADMFED